MAVKIKLKKLLDEFKEKHNVMLLDFVFSSQKTAIVIKNKEILDKVIEKGRIDGAVLNLIRSVVEQKEDWNEFKKDAVTLYLAIVYEVLKETVGEKKAKEELQTLLGKVDEIMKNNIVYEYRE